MMFLVQAGSSVDVYATVRFSRFSFPSSVLTRIQETLEIIYTIKHQSRLNEAMFCRCIGRDSDVLLIGGEDKVVSIYNVPTGPEASPKVIATLVGHTNRYIPFLSHHIFPIS
jgi:protein MAK11